MQPDISSCIYVAFTMFNTAPQFALNWRAFNYNIVLESTNVVPANTAGLNNPGGLAVNWGFKKWQSSRGFCPNISITTIKQ
jgi:hypothetical protein